MLKNKRPKFRKRVRWQSELTKYYYFDLIENERINVTKINAGDVGSSKGSGVGAVAVAAAVASASGKNESDKSVEHLVPWRPLVLIDFSSDLPSPGWNSLERSAQAERENCVLGAIDLPGQPSTLDEPDNYQQSATSASGTTTTPASSARVGGTTANSVGTASSASNNNNDTISGSSSGGKEGEKVPDCIDIPLDSPDGVFVCYQTLYNSNFVNGVQAPSNNPQPILQPFCTQQQSQLLSNQFQTFPLQNLGAQFRPQQQQAQVQIQFPFHQQMPLANPTHLQQQMPQQQQQQQQPQQQQQISPFQPNNLTGPVMPWLCYSFEPNQPTHAALFRG